MHGIFVLHSKILISGTKIQRAGCGVPDDVNSSAYPGLLFAGYTDISLDIAGTGTECASGDKPVLRKSRLAAMGQCL